MRGGDSCLSTISDQYKRKMCRKYVFSVKYGEGNYMLLLNADIYRELPGI